MMNNADHEAWLDKWPIAASGQWLYDGIVPYRIHIHKIPARFSTNRYDGDDQLDESLPIPETPDGYVYRFSSFSKECLALAEALAWAKVQPWGPVQWDDPAIGSCNEN